MLNIALNSSINSESTILKPLNCNGNRPFFKYTNVLGQAAWHWYDLQQIVLDESIDKLIYMVPIGILNSMKEFEVPSELYINPTLLGNNIIDH